MLSQAASAAISCGVIVPSDLANSPDTYNKTLIDLELPDKPGVFGNRRALVAKDQLSARELTNDEIAQREAQHNWQDLDGQLVYNFQHFDDDEYAIVMTTLDGSAKTADDMKDKIAAGGSIIPGKSWVQLGNIKRNIWSGCATKAEAPTKIQSYAVMPF